jgi:hypothetical protein
MSLDAVKLFLDLFEWPRLVYQVPLFMFSVIQLW